MSIKDRLNEYIIYARLNPAEFEFIAKISNGFVGKDRYSMQPSSIEKISKAFTDLNMDWVITGHGEMIKHEKGVMNSPPGNADFYTTTQKKKSDKNKLVPVANNESKGVPYYDVDFMGGFDLVFTDQQIQPSFYIDFLPFNDCDCWINVTGKSMGPLIAHGDIVGLKRVDDWQRFLLEGEIYAIVTDNGFRTIKMIGAGPDKNHYTLIPYNKSEEYRPQIIPKDVITHLFRVKGNIKKFF